MKCKHCGAEIELRYSAYCNERLQERQECFRCNHFMETVELFPGRVLIVNGEMYTVGNEDESFKSRGFSGAAFYFRFLDRDTRYKSTNVWHSGTIPDALRPQMPDNAVWLNPPEYRTFMPESYKTLH